MDIYSSQLPFKCKLLTMTMKEALKAINNILYRFCQRPTSMMSFSYILNTKYNIIEESQL